MEKKVNKTSVLMVVAVVVMLIQCGCGNGDGGIAKTGFLTDYSRLRKESDTTLRYLDKLALSGYSSFIVDPVNVYFHKDAKAFEHRTEGKLTQQQLTDLTDYFHSRIIIAVEDSGNKVVYRPASGVARIRAALTDIDRSTLTSWLPPTKVIMGAGIGGAAMEAEIIDSMTGKQVGAIIESEKGTRIPFANLGEWDASKQVMNDWAKEFQKTLEEVR